MKLLQLDGYVDYRQEIERNKERSKTGRRVNEEKSSEMLVLNCVLYFERGGHIHQIVMQRLKRKSIVVVSLVFYLILVI